MLSQYELAGFCRRVGVAAEAGLDLVRAIRREADRSGAPRAARDCWSDVVASLLAGETLAGAMRRREYQLGPLFVSLIDVAEQSGRLGETLLELADDYDQLLQARREFRASLMMPLFQLGFALVIIGVVILALGIIRQLTGATVDILGFGLIGVRGLIVYLAFLANIALIGGVFVWLFRNRLLGTSSLQYVLLYIPKLGTFLKTLALVRLCRSLYLTLRTGMDVPQAIALSFDAAAFAPISDQKRVVLRELERGGTLTEAFLASRYLGDSIVHHVHVGEEAGAVPEMMNRTAKILMQEVVLLLKQLSVIGFYLVFILVAGIIVFFIFRLASFYLGIIDSVLQ